MARVRLKQEVVRVWLWLVMSSALLLAFTSLSSAHEVQPTVADVTLQDKTATVILDWVIEAPVAGIDLEGVENTDATEDADAYDRLRALPAAELEQAFRDAWPDIRNQMTLSADGSALSAEIAGIRIEEVGDVEVARTSEITLTAPLPDGAEAVVVGFDAALGPLIVRQQGVENGYTAFLTPGSLSDPIPVGGGEGQTAWAAFVDYIGVGFDHIVPLGLDHILFVLGLFFLSVHMGPLLWQVTAFTLAHTVTLALGALGIVSIPGSIVEPLIAASIVYVGVENLFARGLMPWRPLVVFGFGLLHGLGFASVLSDFGLGADHFVPKLIGFNLGVELGQLAVILAAWLAFGAIFHRYPWFFQRIAAPVSIGIALIAAFWVLERTGLIDPDGMFAVFTLLTEGGLPVMLTAIVILAIVAILTVFEMVTISDTIRDFAGFITSFAMFAGVVATFTSGAYYWALGLTVLWILALRLQSLGGPEEDGI